MSKVYTLNPTEVVITNNAVDKEVERDAGAFASQLVVKEDGSVVKVVSGKRTIQLYRVNSFITLEPGDSIKLTTMSAAELAHYIGLATDEISVVPGISEDAE